MPDLYVSTAGSDSNSGTAGAPFRSIAAAAAVAKAGTTVHVAPGNYAGGFTTRASGTATEPITYVSDTPGGARITGAGYAPSAMAWENTGNNVVVTGFEIDGRGPLATSWRVGLYNTGANVVFRSNIIHDILTDATAFASASASGNGGAGMEMDAYSGGVQGSIIGNIVFNIGPPGISSSLVHGIYQVESGKVANNIVYNVVGNGVTMWHGAANIDVVNNTIDGARGGGIFVGSGDYGGTSATGDFIAVSNNIVVNSLWGIAEGGTTGTNNIYKNNLLFNNTEWTVRLQHGLTATGTITAEPMFVNGAARDYHLRSGSPAIDNGTTSATVTYDFDMASRPQGNGMDIGAFEYAVGTANPPPPPSPTPSVPAPQPFTLPVSATPDHTLYGRTRLRRLVADGGNVRLDGKNITHRLVGATTGDDTFVVYSTADTVRLGTPHGVGTIECWSPTYTISENVQNLKLLGSINHLIKDNSLDNLIMLTDADVRDTIVLSSGRDIVQVGKGSADISAGIGTNMFIFTATSSTSSVIHGFAHGEDTIDLRTLLRNAGYSGTNPIFDKTIAFASDNSGGTNIMVDPAHTGTMRNLVNVENLAPSALRMGVDVLWK